jgi:hypothetical protein
MSGELKDIGMKGNISSKAPISRYLLNVFTNSREGRWVELQCQDVKTVNASCWLVPGP